MKINFNVCLCVRTCVKFLRVLKWNIGYNIIAIIYTLKIVNVKFNSSAIQRYDYYYLGLLSLLSIVGQ